MIRALAVPFILLATTAQAQGVIDESRTAPVEVHVVGGNDAKRLLEYTGLDIAQSNGLTERVLVLQGGRDGTPALFIADPRRQTGQEPDEELFVQKFPLCDVRRLRTCCEPQSQSTWIKTNKGWLATGTICLEEEIPEGYEEPLTIDLDLANLLRHLGKINQRVLTFAGLNGLERLLRLPMITGADSCGDMDPCNNGSPGSTSKKKCDEDVRKFYKYTNCNTETTGSEWERTNSDCECRRANLT